MNGDLNQAQQAIFDKLMADIEAIIQWELKKKSKTPPKASRAITAEPVDEIPTWRDTWSQRGVVGLLKRAWGGLSSFDDHNLSLENYVTLEKEVECIVETYTEKIIQEYGPLPAGQGFSDPQGDIKKKLTQLIMNAFVQMNRAASLPVAEPIEEPQKSKRYGSAARRPRARTMGKSEKPRTIEDIRDSGKKLGLF